MKKNVGKALVMIAFILLLNACACEHEWMDATCTAPKTCVKCEEVESDVLAHQWSEATCTSPQTCAECGEKTGSVLPHQWIEATCTIPKTCSECGLSEGNAMGHQWTEASCTNPKTCDLCGETNGEPLDHVIGDWEIDEDSRSISSGTVWIKRYCQICNTAVDMELKSLPLIDGNKFVFTPKEFVDRLHTLNNYLYFSANRPVLATTPEGEMGCSVCGGDAITLFLSEDYGCMSWDLSNATGICTLYTTFFTSDMDEIVDIMIAMILACDNSLEVSDAVNIARSTVLSMLNNDPYIHNSLGYVFGEENGQYKLIISIVQ